MTAAELRVALDGIPDDARVLACDDQGSETLDVVATNDPAGQFVLITAHATATAIEASPK